MRKLSKRPANLLSAYFILTKPGIIIGNLMVAIGAFFYASESQVDALRLASLAFGTICIIAASCVINNYLDCDIDARMSRTARRPSVTGLVPVVNGIVFSGVLAVLGFTALLLGTNVLTALIGLVGAILYSAVYTPLKHASYLATLVGSLPGAVPPLAGFAAAQGYLDAAAWLFFAVLVVWQMPHFYAIAVFRHEEYATAKIPTLAVVKGLRRTITEMRLYIGLFLVLVFVAGVIGLLGVISSVLLVSLGLYWLYTAMQPTVHAAQWARKVFETSLLILPTLSVLLAVGRWLP